MAGYVPNLKLNNGVDIPALGFGTFANVLVAGETHIAVLAALDGGYRHLDCAWYYLNEEEIGAAIREWLSRNPEAKRKDLFITTKVWPHLYEPEDIEWSLNNSLDKLGLDYVDCFLLHWPFAVEKTDDYKVKLGADGKYILKKELTENLEPTWRAMEKLYKAGKTRSIGVSNWKIAQLEAMLKYAEIKPAINQVEIHPFFPNTELLEYCFSHGILPAAYSPLGSQHDTKNAHKSILRDADLGVLAEKKGITLAQLLIAWGLKRGYAVLPKSGNKERIKSNFKIIDLSEEEFEVINKATEGRHNRFVNPKNIFGFSPYPEETS